MMSENMSTHTAGPLLQNLVFAMNGFPCPMLQNPADHYLRKINTDFDEDIEQGDDAGKMTTEEVIDVLAESYKSSDICKQIYRQVAEICRRDGGVIEKKGSQANFFTQCLVLTERSLINMYRDPGYYWWRLAIYMALGSGLGNVFYDVGPSCGSIHVSLVSQTFNQKKRFFSRKKLKCTGDFYKMGYTCETKGGAHMYPTLCGSCTFASHLCFVVGNFVCCSIAVIFSPLVQFLRLECPVEGIVGPF
ncbi:ABC transporter G family member 11-like isoform X2 [Camellia sinensis]|uniref:ABC transporter G family member 11-like isoform X2 n=1 Tax=Camellia sinensis TaxID=4442 RepID=UPI0010362D33|nr:ABC transporter G family member 11-like isoform X2 [Camellia sinensis]XP_028116335.1 ABC transporter G family member 11-like isoform X2 [Camellia sinensis]